jgi:hypothetical protein
MKHAIILLISCISFTTFITAQDFMNGDLEGTYIQKSEVPMYWQSIPYTDVNCMATDTMQATPDLTDIAGPDTSIGLMGNPYSGLTFMSGLAAGWPTNYYHEGIMQTVSGFIIGEIYVINFHQAVVKQEAAFDASGSWAVYVDTVLIGVTNPTYSNAPYNSISFSWEPRSVGFTASDTTLLFKFLPMDDDTIAIFSTTDANAGLRMGIDSIYIALYVNPKGIEDALSAKCASVYPNPFDQSATIKFCNAEKEACTLTLYDQRGRIVRIVTNITADKVEIKKENLASGLYAFQLRTEKEIIAKGKLSIE